MPSAQVGVQCMVAVIVAVTATSSLVISQSVYAEC